MRRRLLAALSFSAPAFASSCEGLASLELPSTTIEQAQTVPAGDYTTSDKITRKAMPAFCRVMASVKDASDSDIRVEIWLPADQWKGVFHGTGNGGYGGVFDQGYNGMEYGVKRGYASATTEGPRRRRRSMAIRSSAIRKNGRTGEAFRPM